jgi:hypothetical protein
LNGFLRASAAENIVSRRSGIFKGRDTALHYHVQNHLTNASIYLFGGMVMAEFILGDRCVCPLYLPAWATEDIALGHLDNLRGDFLCVPFGGASAQNTLPQGWDPDNTVRDPDEFFHGYSAHHVWRLAERTDEFLRIVIEYPRDHPVEGLERTVVISPDQPKVFFEDRIHVRRDCMLPVGLHPIFRLPAENCAAKLCLPDCRTIRTYPCKLDASATFAHDVAIHSAEAVPLRCGGTMDATRLPMELSTEELLMMCQVETGRVDLENREEGYRAVLEWDAGLLNGCLLWLSNRGRSFEPWNGKNVCLGIEPITSAFDLGTAVSLGRTPLDQATGFSMKAGRSVTLKHSISVEECHGKSNE